MGKQSKAQEAQARREYQEARRREEAERQKKQNQKMWSIIIGVVAVVLILTTVAIALGASKDKSEEPKEEAPAVSMDQLDFSAVALEKCVDTDEVTDHVRMNVTYTDKNGEAHTENIIIRLYAQVAPKTVANFQNLVKSGFYNGLIFHRVVEGFMIQGGGFDINMTQKTATTIAGEMTANGFTNNLSHVRGVLSMARTSSGYNTGSSQFFIMHQDNTNLDNGYASFGYVVYGMDTVDAIALVECETAENSVDDAPSQPVRPVVINSVTFVKVTE